MLIVLSCKKKLITRMIFLLIIICVEFSSQMNMNDNSQIGLSKLNEKLTQIKEKINSYYIDIMQTNNHSKCLLYISIFLLLMIGLVLYFVYKSVQKNLFFAFGCAKAMQIYAFFLSLCKSATEKPHCLQQCCHTLL